jgi:hypothetical protein
MSLIKQGKVPMEKEPCNWYMIKVAEEFGIQYTGDDVDEVFPLDLTGEDTFRDQRITR